LGAGIYKRAWPLTGTVTITAPSVTVKLALCSPEVVGAKATEKLQVAAGRRADRQLFFVSTNSPTSPLLLRIVHCLQHFLNFLPLPQGQGSLRPTVGSAWTGWAVLRGCSLW
jgi:hypothetical protein